MLYPDVSPALHALLSPACEIPKPHREVEPKKIKNLKFREDSRLDIDKEGSKREISSVMKREFDPRGLCGQTVSEESKEKFLSQ